MKAESVWIFPHLWEKQQQEDPRTKKSLLSLLFHNLKYYLLDQPNSDTSILRQFIDNIGDTFAFDLYLLKFNLNFN